MTAQPTLNSRTVERIVRGVATSDGAGVKLTRVLTQDLQQRLDPFLMLDAFGSDKPDEYIAGFPDHPHRGFETVTYMLEGRLRHRDNHGGAGSLGPGGVQWMTAGRGIVHSEFPEQDRGMMAGFQLWLNLPGKDKMCAPGYRDLPDGTIPVVRTADGVSVKIIAGAAQGRPGAMTREGTEPIYLDLHVPAGRAFSEALPATHNAFVYVYEGAVKIGDPDGAGAAASRTVKKGEMGVLTTNAAANGVTLVADSAAGDAKLLLIAGKPLREPIAQYGPFVMNTHEQLVQAVQDYQAGRF
jgi:redox-sensitive bicupin YhaK (pirin superfamily)